MKYLFIGIALLAFVSTAIADEYDEIFKSVYKVYPDEYLNNQERNDDTGSYSSGDGTTATPDYQGGFYHSEGTHRSPSGRVYNDNASRCYYDGYGALHCE
jgi:hypothetical protein